MTAYTGYVDNLAGGLANEKMLDVLKSACEANGWVTQRYVTNTDVHELILKGVGLSGDRQIFIGFRSYKNANADYYNLSVAGFTGYVASNTFEGQPGYMESGIPSHNQRIDYWMSVNQQRILFGLKVGTPVYEFGYVGLAFPFATPGQYPYPLVVAGMLDGLQPIRYSDLSHSMPFKGSRNGMRIRFVDGTYLAPSTFPWNARELVNSDPNSFNMRDVGNNYTLLPVILQDVNNTYGRLDGVYYVTGFNLVVEDTAVINGKNFIILQDVGRNSFADYVALELS